MKNTLKGLILITIAILVIFNLNSAPQDLEIYTSSNIYYVKGLKVTNETNTDTIQFKDYKSLKNYISTVTANECKQ